LWADSISTACAPAEPSFFQPGTMSIASEAIKSNFTAMDAESVETSNFGARYLGAAKYAGSGGAAGNAWIAAEGGDNFGITIAHRTAASEARTGATRCVLSFNDTLASSIRVDHVTGKRNRAGR